MNFKKIFSSILFFCFLNFSFCFSSEKLPSTPEELEKFFFDFLKEFPSYFFKALDQVLKITKKTWNFFWTHFFQKIYFSTKKEVQKREPIVKKEFEKEKLEIKKEFKEWLSSILNKIQSELKKK
jgi:hypothetical protein